MIAASIIGFTIYAPEERARGILREEIGIMIEAAVKRGKPQLAEALIRGIIQSGEGLNPLDLNSEDLAWLEEQLRGVQSTE